MCVPNLRFPQFKEPWMNYKASELLTTVSTNSLSWEQLTYAPNSSFKNLHYGLIHNGFETTGITGQSNLLPYINPSFLPTKYTLIQDGDLILADASEDRKDVGKPVEMLDVRNQKVVSGLHTIHAKNKTNLISIGFKGFYFQSEAMKKQIFKIANGSKIFGISATNFNELNMCIPSHPEQKIIVDLMGKIESRIQTQIIIIEDCMSYRNAIVDYFFESLSSDWKQVRLSNILNEYSELHIKDNSIVHATLSKDGIFPKTDRYDRDFLVKDEDKKYKVSHLNDICYNPANLKFGVITRNIFGDCIISPIYITFKIKNGYLPKFIELLVTRKKFISKARKYEQGTVYERMAVNSSDLLSMHVLIPSFSMQQKIVNIINDIDNKISNEKKLLNLYKTQKSYLLKNMFV